MTFVLKASVAVVAALMAGGAFAASTGGFSTADGGNLTGAKSFTAATYQEINKIIADARLDAAGKKVATGAYPVIITYTGNEDALINQVIKDHTVDASGNCPKPRWSEAYKYVEIKNFTAGITIQGANGSSANFGIVINGGSKNVVIKNMKIGALPGASNDADMLRIDSASNVWIDHNELFAVNNECKGSPDGDLTFESAIDIKKDSHNITVSYNYIHDSKKVGLDGSSSSDIGGGREITFHHNVYYNVNGRLPLQRGGWIHVYNNAYDKITESGINVRTGGYALIEKNSFTNSVNPVTCRYDTVNCGKWDLRDNLTSNITWTDPGAGGINATDWSTTGAFPKTLTYTYEPVSAQCVKDKLAQYAGVGKNGAQLTAAACGNSSSSAASSSKASSSAASSSSVASSSKASSSAASSSSKSSSSSTSSAASSAPAMTGTGDYPAGFSKCAALGETCTAKSTGWVAFGRKGKWVAKYVGSGKTIACTVAAFGSDPLGDPNKCSTK